MVGRGVSDLLADGRAEAVVGKAAWRWRSEAGFISAQAAELAVLAEPVLRRGR